MNGELTVNRFFEDSLTDMISFIRREFNAPTFSPKITISFSEHRNRSWGGMRKGVPFVSFAAKRFIAPCVNNSNTNFKEYKHFSSDPVIGSVLNVHWTKAVLALIAHELSHALQYFKACRDNVKSTVGLSSIPDSSEAAFRNHNIFWQKIYAKLRINFVNNIVDRPFTVVNSEVCVAVVHNETKPYNKAWTSKTWRKGTTRMTAYFDGNGDEVGVLAITKEKRIYQLNKTAKTWEQVLALNIVEARKLVFDF
jgi:hypothetical protein